MQDETSLAEYKKRNTQKKSEQKPTTRDPYRSIQIPTLPIKSELITVPNM